MIHYFYGEDTYAARQAIDEVAKEHKATIRWLDGRAIAARPVREWGIQSQSLFGQSLSVIREPSRLPESSKAAMKELGKTGEWVLWEAGTPPARSWLGKAFRTQARRFAYLDVARLVTWIGERVTNRGGTITPAVAQQLIDRVGLDRWQLTSELEKLLLTNPTITAQQVGAITLTNEPEASIFDALTAVARGDQRLALRGILTLLAGGASELYSLSMIAYQFRTMLLVRVGEDAGKSDTIIAQEAGLKPFVVGKTRPLVQAFSPARLQDYLTKILATDFAIKQGKVDARTGLMLLILSKSR